MSPFSANYRPVLKVTAKERANAKVSRIMAARNQDVLDRNGPTTNPDAEQRWKDKIKNDKIRLVEI